MNLLSLSFADVDVVDVSAVHLLVVSADAVVDVVVLVVVLVVVVLFDPFLPDVVDDKSDVEDEERAVLDALQAVLH